MSYFLCISLLRSNSMILSNEIDKAIIEIHPFIRLLILIKGSGPRLQLRRWWKLNSNIPPPALALKILLSSSLFVLIYRCLEVFA